MPAQTMSRQSSPLISAAEPAAATCQTPAAPAAAAATFPAAPLSPAVSSSYAAPDAAAAASLSPAAPLRLTRRGRLVFIGLPLMLTAAAALTVLGFFTAPAMASSGGPDLTRTLQVSVSPGDSLWGLAEEFAPERDPRDVVADIVELNNLPDERVPAGVQLFIPVQS
ncbi:LysM peptidoglycan-binding domain-containing protein [Arthrobacter sp. ATA002]|uniref:LysM peptidoglycan-binding domain-containing protein n=1 Tax=Arthrobacter sp. ATA002 TaxID=2991715 RepID=UPI0022A7415B|nr:LysM peptidoglycan-binding domain-containing protein [Arthrobacter sp. ATA002]WAP51006.1 LysM peptidoglycan-binding domain-containing protein [Arthrobacter sp. ATA002]